MKQLSSKRIRAVAIVCENNKLLVIHRKVDGREYYTLPGGGQEIGESVEEAVLRELLEETSIEASITKLLYVHHYEVNEQYFYLCKYVSGNVKLAEDAVERQEMSDTNSFTPQWVNLDDLHSLLLYPLEVRDLIIQDSPSSFAGGTKDFYLSENELKQTV